MGIRSRMTRLALLVLPAVAFASTGCLGYTPEGLVATPTPPTGESAASRLPQLLSQLQGGSAGLELFDGSENQVLAAQDEQTHTKGDGSGTPANTPEPTGTVAGTRTPGTNATPSVIAQDPPTRTATPQPTGTATPEPTATSTPEPTQTPTPTPTATPFETSTPTPAPTTPAPTPPAEGTAPLPPTE